MGRDPRIRFRGLVTGEAQTRLWDSLDLLVLPSLWWENSPLVLHEALAAGVPVVASRTGGVPEILPAGTGVLVEPGDVEGLRCVLGEIVAGHSLAEAHPAIPLKTTHQGARELVALYGELARAQRGAENGEGP